MQTHLNNPNWQSEVKRLHQLAEDDPQRWQERKKQQLNQSVTSGPDPLVRMGELFLAVDAQQGRMLYLLARAAKAKYIVEFGASYGISTLYLGAAAGDNGGKLITTEVHPDKCASIRQTISAAQLDEHIELIEGDARVTLPAQKAGIEFLFLDGWKSQYLPLLENLTPLLAPSALVVADNINHEGAKDYAHFIQNSPNWFTEFFTDMAISLPLQKS